MMVENAIVFMQEDTVKKAAVQYLKSYYRFRPRFDNADGLNSTIAQTDMLASNGIYADGHLSFVDEKGKNFIATFEATSSDTAFEVRFRLEKNLLFWDAIAVSVLLCTFVFSYFYAYQNTLIEAKNGGLIFASIIFIILVINILYRIFFKNLARYRSIFAIEQFKQYYADEQWLAISHDVFPDVNDEYFKELKKQCVYNGFGLLEVDAEQDLHLHITPAREVVYGKNRAKVSFFSGIASHQYTQKAVSWTEAIGQKVLQPITENSLLRFHRPFYNQWLITAVSTLILTTVFYRFMQQTDKNIVDERFYPTEILEKTTDVPETNYIPDSLPLRSFKDKKNNYLDQVLVNNEPVLAQTEITFTEKGGAEDGVYLNDGIGKLRFFDCAKLNLEGNNYVIMESAQMDLATAQRHVFAMQKKGIALNTVWLGCFSRANLSYVIFYDLIYENKNDAIKKRNELLKLLKMRGVATEKVNIVSLTNPE